MRHLSVNINSTQLHLTSWCCPLFVVFALGHFSLRGQNGKGLPSSIDGGLASEGPVFQGLQAHRFGSNYMDTALDAQCTSKLLVQWAALASSYMQSIHTLIINRRMCLEK